MRNNRNGTFRDVTAETGMNQNNTRYSFCCAWNDFNGDGWPDLYVVNDFGRKNLYRNNGNGTFTDVAAEAGVEDIGAGMSVAWFNDANQSDNNSDDSKLVNHRAVDSDLYVANMWTAAGERITMQDQFKRNSPPEVKAQYHKHAMGNSLFLNSSVSSASPVVQGVALELANPINSRGDPEIVRCNRCLPNPRRPLGMVQRRLRLRPRHPSRSLHHQRHGERPEPKFRGPQQLLLASGSSQIARRAPAQPRLRTRLGRRQRTHSRRPHLEWLRTQYLLRQ